MDINTFKAIIDAYFDDKGSLPLKELSISSQQKTYLIESKTPVILKINHDAIEKNSYKYKVLERLKKEGANIQGILYTTQKDVSGKLFSGTVLEYLEGDSLSRYPTAYECKVIIDEVYKLTKASRVISKDFKKGGPPTVFEILLHFTASLDECYIKKVFDSLLENDFFVSLMKDENTCLYHGDLWIENVLLRDYENEKRVSIIDAEPLIFSHHYMQPAQLFSAYFLLSSILFDKHQLFNIDFLFELWPEKLDKKTILYLMLIFPITIGMMKEIGFKTSNIDSEMYENIMGPLHKSIDYILNCLSQLNEK